MKKYLFGILTFALGFGVLSVTYLSYYSVSYASNLIGGDEKVLGVKTPDIDYVIPYEGGVGPDNTLWSLKVIRDKTWYYLTFDKLKKLELNLLFSDKRLASAKNLFDKKKPDIGLSTLTKGENYLVMASGNLNNIDFAKKLAIASLKHRQIIEEDILPLAPDDLKPQIIKTLDKSKETYKVARDYLNSQNSEPPKNPFND